MNKPGDGGLFIFLPRLLEKEINILRRKYSVDKVLPRAHISLTYPPFLTIDEWKRERCNITKILSVYKQFTISFKEAGIFPRSGYLWLKPDCSPLISEMHGLLSTYYSDFLKKGLNLLEFIPHLTMGHYESEEELNEQKENLNRDLKKLDLRFTVSEIYFVYAKTNHKWGIYDMFSIGK